MLDSPLVRPGERTRVSNVDEELRKLLGFRMDFFTRAAETVRQQADKAAVQARGLAQQISDQTKVIADQTKTLAEQASSSAAAAAEQASAKLRNLQIQESFNAGVNTLGSATTAAAEQATARLQNIKLPDSINTGVSTLNATLTNTLNRVAAPGGGKPVALPRSHVFWLPSHPHTAPECRVRD